MNYLALGDSISIDDYTGVLGGGAARQFALLIDAQNIENLTSDGQTTSGVIAALRYVTIQPDIVTLTAGGNDFLQWAFLGSKSPADYWKRVPQETLENLRTIAAHLAEFHCPVIFNTIYNPTDGDDALLLLLGIPPAAREGFDAINAEIKALARQHGFLLADLEALFHGHGLRARETWYEMQIEPNYAGATAIARHWLERFRNGSNSSPTG